MHIARSIRADGREEVVEFQPMRDIFHALQQIRYTGFVDLEYEVHADDPLLPLAGALRSFAASS